MTNIELFFKDYIFKLKEDSESKIYKFNSFNYSASFEDMAKERANKYIEIFTGIKPKIKKIIKDAELGYDKTAKVLLNNRNKESIALAILAMRNELIDNKNSNIDLIGNAYMSGYTIPQKNIGYILENEDINDKKAIELLQEEYKDDINRFIVDFSDRIDNISEEYDLKNKKGMKWTWFALLALLFSATDSLNYRLSLISKEPFRRAFRRGAIDGIKKIAQKQNKKIIRVIWETTGDNPCQACQNMDGRELPIDKAESFLHPNCACTLTVIFR